MFRYADVLLSKGNIPRSVVENAQPFLVMLGLAQTKGYHGQVARNARALADALLLGGKVDETRQACELVRLAGNEMFDSAMQAWAQHQLGTLSVLSGDVADGLLWLESAELLRDHMGDVAGKLHSQRNALILRKTPGSAKGKKNVRVVWDITMISWAIGLSAIVAIGQAFGLSSAPVPKAMHAHGYARVHLNTQAHSHTALSTVQAHVALPVLLVPPKKIIAAARINVVVPLTPPVSHHYVKSNSTIPSVARFTTSSRHVAAGAFTALCYKISNATSAFLEPVGKINAHSGCVSDAPRINTYYTLYAYNQNGMASASVFVGVLQSPVRREPPSEEQPHELRIP